MRHTDQHRSLPYLVSIVLSLTLFHTTLGWTQTPIKLHRDGDVLYGMISTQFEQKKALALLLHDSLGSMHDQQVLMWAEKLEQADIAVLRINLRLNDPDRTGLAPCQDTHKHHHLDALPQLQRWIQWLTQQGVRHIYLGGIGRGANQVTRLATTQQPKLIAGLLLINPLRWNLDQQADRYKQQHNQALFPQLGRIIKLNMDGKHKHLVQNIGFFHCQQASVQASSFFSYYNDDSRLDTYALLKQLTQPVWQTLNRVPTQADTKHLHDFLNERLMQTVPLTKP
ncbi:hypothetical protein [Magnetococcus sp. PR-3]|uniref:hypothetical protein n=1 Tax=Magnetococcus sp. PR-3 TaxID=3120355 RepID=UPI002FCE34AD